MTNCWLVNRAGSELYVRDVALGLQRRGHEPVVWSPVLGPMAAEIRAAGVQVIDDLGAPTPEPDLLHCQHHDETLAALARFPDRPGLFVQHGATSWQEEAPLHPRLLRHVAVDELCRQRLLASGVAPDRISVIPNGVDLSRFAPRDPLPARPRRALALSNTATEAGFLTAVRAACARHGIELDVAGLGVGAPMHDPAGELHNYDVVFGKARVALEALAVGCAVVVVDEPGVAGMVTHAALPEWLRWNLGRHLLTAPHDVDLLSEELDRYDPEDAARCRDHVRAHRDLELTIDALLDEQDRVLAAWAEAPEPAHDAELRALSTRLSLIGPLRVKGEALDWHTEEHRRMSAALEDAMRQIDGLHAQVEALDVHGDALRVERDALRGRRAVRWVEAMAGRRNGRAG
jgi:glycosyltransferase involved in cell wall biosynthesis